MRLQLNLARASSLVALRSLALALSLCGALRAEPARTSSVVVDAHSELSGYADSDAVRVLTPALRGSVRDDTAGISAQGSYLVDIISAASVDIVSTASPHWTEQRHAATLGARYQPGDLGLQLGGVLSSEPDYLSRGVNGAVHWSLAQDAATLALGYGYSRDTAGVVDTPFAVYSLDLDRHAFDASLGLVLDRSTLLTLIGDVWLERGRQEKPYRYLPMFDADTASRVKRGASVDSVNAARLPGRMDEHDPISRQRFALSARYARRGAATTLLLQERVYVDTWGQWASTTEYRHVFELSRRFSVWPRVRLHAQTGVSFWRIAYVATLSPSGLDLPRYRTGDRELSPLLTGTLAVGGRLQIGRQLGLDESSVVLELEGGQTSFRDALYVSERWSLFGALMWDARF